MPVCLAITGPIGDNLHRLLKVKNMDIRFLFLVVLGVLVCVVAGIIVIVVSRRRVEATVPRCGNCGYNLTGAPSNRCPECGMLFIEAGVITRQPRPSPSRGVIRVVMLILVGFTVLAVLGTIAMGMQARAARARAVAARQAALQSQAQAAAQQATTTAPAPEDRPATQPPETP